jgi:hypothetical protein
MAIAEAKREAAVQAYIDSGFNKTKTYMAVNPNAEYETANAHGSNFVVKCGIEEEAVKILQNKKELRLSEVLSGFSDDLSANKTVFYKGKRIDDIKDNAIRLEARKFLIEKVYGIGKDRGAAVNNGTVININVDKLGSLIGELKVLGDKIAGTKKRLARDAGDD